MAKTLQEVKAMTPVKTLGGLKAKILRNPLADTLWQHEAATSGNTSTNIKAKTLFNKLADKLGEVISPANILKGASRVPAERPSARLNDKLLLHWSQITAEYLMKIIRDKICAVEIKLLTSQTHTYKL